MLLAAIPAMRGVLEELKSTGTVEGMIGRIASFRDLFDLMGMPKVRELESRYGVDESAQARY
jgi:NADPH-dependent ferric siderophore reductase